MKKTCYLMSSCLSYVLFLQVAQLATGGLFGSNDVAHAATATHSSSASLSVSLAPSQQVPSYITYNKYVAGLNDSDKFKKNGMSVTEPMVGDFIRSIDLALDEKVYAVGPDDVVLNLYGIQQILQPAASAASASATTEHKHKHKEAAAVSSSSTTVSAIQADSTVGMFKIAEIRFIGASVIKAQQGANSENSAEQQQVQQQ